MFHKSNVNETGFFFLVLLNYREIITVKTVTLSLKVIDHVYMRPEKNSNRFEISLGIKFHFGVR